MTRDEARELLPIIQAFVEGKTVQCRDFKDKDDDWDDTLTPAFDIDNFEYRIKPKPECRPFKDVEECWQEMLKHQPFGWVKNNGDITVFKNIVSLAEGFVGVAEQDTFDLCEMWEAYTFADGTPFGVKEGEEFLACVKC